MGILRDFHNRKIEAQEGATEYDLPTGQTFSAEDIPTADDPSLKDPHDVFRQLSQYALDNVDTTKEFLSTLLESIPPYMLADTETMPVDDPDFVFGGAIDKLDLVEEFLSKYLKTTDKGEIEKTFSEAYKEWYRNQIRKPEDKPIQYSSEDVMRSVDPGADTLTD